MIFFPRQSLKAFNTFGIAAQCRAFCRVSTSQELVNALEANTRPFLVLGGGSNILFTEDYDGLVIKNEIRGTEVVKEDDARVWVKAGAGEGWHDFVLYCIDRGWGGLENLSLIPGTVGAAPMQNIGAYGTEIREVFYELTALDTRTHKPKTFNKDECHFGYRESIFKHEAKGQYIITDVTFELSKTAHRLNTAYGAIQEMLREAGVSKPGIREVSNAVIKIRQSKLPDPRVTGNAGSFFKNPTVASAQYHLLKQEYADMPGYRISESHTKVPAGWLIEQCGWKGFREGHIGVHERQALVLVNYGGGQGAAIAQLAERIRQSVKQQFDIHLHTEVNII